ncbi:FHA domain-containing protein [Selenomonas caprae]|uniref:FHA domain-containing protein n=1 Tax=Selenomonas caprae TaxID=2606905 RepID=A0A5D6WSX8_9FIRM|nr:FHA domain-containing protein [Selenomonas caprae]TYZ30239.1 FHA domain-containing protein [Selenomonas caprae]
MYRKQITTALLGIAGIALSILAGLTDLGNPAVSGALIALGLVLFLWAVASLIRCLQQPVPEVMPENPAAKSEPAAPAGITQLNWLSEKGDILKSWNLFNRTGLVIGRDYQENMVDIDLEKSPYAPLIDIEHAVLNYANAEWYVEDLSSRNGTQLCKARDGRKYQLTAGEPCKVEIGDIIIVGMTQLELA